MPNSEELIIEFKVIELAKIIRETSIKFDGLNTKMDEVDIKC
uniref:Uncharacterized protein n=1 Tax=Wolbachia endosymbiont of Aleurodicus floccissimus TaxID=2152762 RepID=A0A3B0J0X8_9RICK